MSQHDKERIQCNQCSRSYSRQDKLKKHQLHHHRDKKNPTLRCTYCSKDFARAFTLKRHAKECSRKSVNATKPDLAEMLVQMTASEREYRQELEKGKMVSTLLHSNEYLSEESLTTEYKHALKIYRQSEVQHVSVYENALLKPWQNKVLEFMQQPSQREVIWVIGREGGEGKTFLQNYIKYYYGDRRVIATDIATDTKNIAHFLTKFSLECKDIFLFNHPCSSRETVAYDMLEGIKDGYKVSGKYNTRGLHFKTPNTVIVFSNDYPRTEALKKDRWRIYEIRDEQLFKKTFIVNKTKGDVIEAYKNYTVYDV